MSQYDLVVIGSGPAGQKAAIAASKMGKKVAVVERSMSVGGACLHHGTIPSKTLREAVSYLSGVRQRELYGAAYRVKDKITIEDLSFRTQRVIEREVNVVRDQLLRNYVDIVGGTGCFVDAHKILVTTEKSSRILETKKTILAVGTKPSRPSGIEFDECKIVDSDGLLKLAEIPRSMTFVGGGIIGVEYATIFRTIGVRVTLIDGRQRPLDFIDDEIEDNLYFYMRDEGITLRFGETVCAVRHTEDGRVQVFMESGKQLETDGLMFAAGREGASKDLNLEAIGLETDKRDRIQVDEFYRTSVEDVYAVGDIIGFPSLASTSMEQGRIAAMHAMADEATAMAKRLPYGIYTIPEIAMVGPTEEELTKDEVPYETGIARFRELSRVQISGGSGGLLKILFNREDRKLIAVHILGEQATELVHIGQVLIDHGATIDYLRDTVFNYPTLSAAYKVAALDGFNKL